MVPKAAVVVSEMQPLAPARSAVPVARMAAAV